MHAGPLSVSSWELSVRTLRRLFHGRPLPAAEGTTRNMDTAAAETLLPTAPSFPGRVV